MIQLLGRDDTRAAVREALSRVGETLEASSVVPARPDQKLPVRIQLGRSDDVARAVMFFCARENSFITGQTLYVCGGASLGSIII